MSHLSIKGLTFSYGQKQVLNDLFLDVKPNQIYGFIGRNGAGKTTTIHCLLGYLEAHSGEMLFEGEDITKNRIAFKKAVGYVSDVPLFPPFYKAHEYLRFVGELYHVEGLDARIQEILERIDLKKVTQPIGAYSRGMRQRLAIGAAMLSRPRLLIMDEPTSALDPLGRDQVLALMETLKKETTILYSTHILNDAERVSDRIGILEHGRLLCEGDLKTLLTTDTIISRLELYEAASFDLTVGSIKKLSPTSYDITVLNASQHQTVWSELAALALPIKAFYPIHKTLTSLYYEVLDAHAH